MNKPAASWSLAILLMVLLACAGCNQQTPTVLPSPSAAPAVAAVGGDAGASPTSTSTATPTPSPTLTATPTASSTPTETPTTTPTYTPTPRAGGPYVVTQTQTQGGEKISGQVCSVTNPFQVTVAAPKITFVFMFSPAAPDRGQFSYAYSIPGAGETHAAQGRYTLQTLQPAGAGTLVLKMTGSDHVVFHGFDGNIPFRYQFSLVPAANLPCP